jgi:H+-translocating NAD(P) transhydrogenase subunit beta
MTETLIQLVYLVASVLFIMALRGLGRAETARSGMRYAMLGMALAVLATLANEHIVAYEWILVGLVVGSVMGYPMGMWVPMTAMPQRIAFSHTFGALAATLVGVGEYMSAAKLGAGIDAGKMTALGFEVLFGALTVTGSLMAFGKLQGLLPGQPKTYPHQNTSNLVLFGLALSCFVYLIWVPEAHWVFWLMLLLAFVIGVLMVVPIGGADMPVVIALLNSYAGLAAAATGFALNNNILIIAGALDGASGFILALVMSRAMNRSFGNVMFGAFGSAEVVAAAISGSKSGTMVAINAEDAALRLAYAQKVVIVPGYGMAVSQAQHQVRELAELIEKRGVEVRFAIHPVAGRMPGHMNVLLAEAGVHYDKLLEMDEVNAKFPETDVALVIGANDVVNPAARTNTGSPIYGMPILNVHEAKSILVLKRGAGTGFSGVENELFIDPKTSMLYGDAKDSLGHLIVEVKAA